MLENSSVKQELAEIAAAIKHPSAFEPLYKRHFQAIYLYIRKSIGNADVASDITSDVFYLALVNLKDFKATSLGIKPWLYKIALNQLRMHFRKSKKSMYLPLQEEHLNSFVSLDQKIELNEMRRILSQQLSLLSEEEQEFIQLRFIAECSFRELGIILNISEDAAKMRMSRLLDRLKRNFHNPLKPRVNQKGELK
jgi:RNA polymerase sigma-70 factor (ECF subfamily)